MDHANSMIEDMPRQTTIDEQEMDQLPVVQTTTVYSWFYYEREDQFDQLFESLNLKGQRERKL